MSDEVFDPEKAERVRANADFTENGVRKYYGYEVVQAEDYDKLLALYREAIQRVDDQRFEDRTH